MVLSFHFLKCQAIAAKQSLGGYTTLTSYTTFDHSSFGINPQEIEDVLLASGLMVEAIVIGVPDDILGEKTIALVVPKNEEGKKKILDYCFNKLPKYKIPSDIQIVKTLPKNAVGKFDRVKCAELSRK